VSFERKSTLGVIDQWAMISKGNSLRGNISMGNEFNEFKGQCVNLFKDQRPTAKNPLKFTKDQQPKTPP